MFEGLPEPLLNMVPWLSFGVLFGGMFTILWWWANRIYKWWKRRREGKRESLAEVLLED